jgi:hypothetical protein
VFEVVITIELTDYVTLHDWRTIKPLFIGGAC